MVDLKLNCWQFHDCGREPGGRRVDSLGVCPAATSTDADGINGGINGGRLCWAVAGTFCGGRVQGSVAAKRQSCISCPFFDRVLREEGVGIVLIRPGQTAWIGRR